MPMPDLAAVGEVAEAAGLPHRLTFEIDLI